MRAVTLTLDGCRWSTLQPGRFSPGKTPGTYCTGSWVGPRAGMDACGKISPLPGFDPQTFQPTVSRYTDYAILAHVLLMEGNGQTLFKGRYKGKSI